MYDEGNRKSKHILIYNRCQLLLKKKKIGFEVVPHKTILKSQSTKHVF